jgi:gamma-glutamyltranspeptidase / glutathione hydrolase
MNTNDGDAAQTNAMFVERSAWKPAKEEVVARNGLVTAMQPPAAEVGLEILKKGGNAIDAAVAMVFCNVVLEPYMANIGGMGYMLIHLAKEGKTVAIDFTCRAPRNAHPDMYPVIGPDLYQQLAKGPERGGFDSLFFAVENEANNKGPLSVTVPTVCAGICEAHKRYGKLPLKTLIEPAIHMASEGFETGWDLTLYTANLFNAFNQDPFLASMWLPNGRPPRSYPKPGEKIVQRDLGELLKRIANHGPNAMYQGEIPEAIDEYMRKNGGILTRQDMEEYRPDIFEPLSVPFKRYRVKAVPTPGGAITNMQTFKILDSFDLTSMGHNSVEYLNLLIQSTRHTFADRHRYLADWEQAPVPLKGLLSAEYAKELARQVDLKKAGVGVDLEEEPWLWYMKRRIHDPWKFDPAPAPNTDFPSAVDTYKGDTSHINVVDKDRNVVSCTHTGPFIPNANPPSTGVYLMGGMSLFIAKPGYANSIAGWKRSISSMAPLIIFQNGKPVLSVGAPGGRRIMSRVLQVVNNIIIFGMGPQEAIIQPTIDAITKNTVIDSRIPEGVVKNLEKLGHRIKLAQEEPGMLGNFSRPSAIYIDPETGLLRAGVDAFRPAMALGY